MATKSNTELAVFEPSSFEVMFDPNSDAAEVIAENMAGEGGISPLALDRIRIPGSAGKRWEIPTLGEPDMSPTVEGIIIANQRVRTWWEKDLNDKTREAGAPPDCSSDDGITGLGAWGKNGDRGHNGDCATCPMAQFGSDPKHADGEGGGRQWCREARLLYILPEGRVLPMVVVLPPSSLRPWKQYLQRMSASAIPYYGVVTSIGLEQKAEPVEHSVATFSTVSILDRDQRAVVRQYQESLNLLTAGAAVASSDAADVIDTDAS